MDNSICNKDFKIFMENLKSANHNTVIIEATVPTGMEKLAVLDLQNKFCLRENDLFILHGRVFFITNISNFHAVKELRSIDNINLVTLFIPSVGFTSDKESDIEKIKQLAHNHDILNAVENWQKLMNTKYNVEPTREEHDIGKSIRQQSKQNLGYEQPNENNVLKYRVTCERSFTHAFTSVEAQYNYGAILNDKYNWIVALDDFDINIILYIAGDSILICLKLTKFSLHNRSLVELGPTSLRPTIAYNMLQMCNIQSADVVIDPLCGGGSVPIEAVLAYANALRVIAGDINSQAVERCMVNVKALKDNINKPDIFLWNAQKLPFNNDSIDVICTDLPFGKRSCPNTDVRLLYKELLKEFARVIKKDKGRICLLVHKAHKVISGVSKALCIDRKITINVGGLKCYVFLIRKIKS